MSGPLPHHRFPHESEWLLSIPVDPVAAVAARRHHRRVHFFSRCKAPGLATRQIVLIPRDEFQGLLMPCASSLDLNRDSFLLSAWPLPLPFLVQHHTRLSVEPPFLATVSLKPGSSPSCITPSFLMYTENRSFPEGILHPRIPASFRRHFYYCLHPS